MALLPVPALAEKHARNSSASIGSGAGSYTSFSLFLHSQCRNRSSRLAIANIAEVHQDSQQRQHWQSATRFKENGKKRKSSPPGNPSHNRAKQHAPARDAHHPRGGRLPVPWRQREGPQDDRCNVEDAAGAENSTHGLAQRSAMARIVEKLRDMQKAFHSTDQVEAQHSTEGGCISDQRNVEVEGGRILPSRTAGELFLPKPNQDLFSIGSYWSTPDHPVPAPGRGVLDTKFPWELDDQDQQKEEENKRVKPLTLAELTIPPDQLRRLRSIGIQLQNPVRVGRLGVTDNIADGILGRWRSCELVKVKCEGPAVVNMMKIHRDLERKTGGFVIWRAGSVAVVYRGSDYDTANRVASSLERKLEGLISSGRLNAHAKSTLHDMNKADAKKVLHEVSEATWDSKLDTQSTVLQFDVSGIDQEKDDATDQDLILPGKLTNGHAKSTLHDMNEPDNDEVLHETSETTVDSRIEANSIMLQPNVTRVGQEKGDAADVNTDLGIVQTIRRLNVTPDPYIDREYEMEVEGILEGLGPRCQDWTGLKPAPVDADLLPPTIPNYRPPYRLLPYGVKPKLSNHEQTNLRRLVRPMAPHFALGRNKGQQGLAVAILKLWERSEVAKIAVKTGVQNTSSEKMAEELKRLTGGVLLARDKYFITLYRGKDFLPQQVALALTERTSMLRSVKEGEESIGEGKSIGIPPSTTVTTEKALEGKPEQNRVKREAAKARCLTLAGQLERKLSMAVEKKEKAEQDLEKLEGFLMPVGQPADSETITEEERFMYRRLGLKMSAFLLVGRRGVFDGLVENMHLHWKHRELVKLIVKERDPVQLQKTARMLEYESGGVLIAVVSTSKGQAIIMYRGKNYQRPSLLRPHNLLTKKKALERSLEMQRHVSLSKHIQALEEEISKMKAGLTEAGEVKDDISHVALGGDCSSLSSINLENDGVHEDEQGEVPMTAGDKHSLSEDGTHTENPCANKKELVRLVGLGPIYRADPLTNLERLKLRREALKLGVGARFNVGKSNVLVGLARALRVHFLSHALVVIGVKNRGRGTSVQDLVHELEDLTGGVLVSQEPNKIIMYRGWPSGERMPMSGSDEELSPELRAALEAEEDEWDLVDDDSFLTSEGDGSDVEGEADEDDDMGMLFDEADGDADEEYDSTQQLDSDQSSIGKQDDEQAEV